ncbi:enoyl-CoA delta isomerase 1, peroxisomal [Momordica charantia]|uniref:Delta(3)-Delta(2)-enoyl-CoA isomerase n=1 Tax=Momordica charantia TaxID=3673 RepID=A0A6J1BVD7_MOMCH|nr:enoyl-CoA delta isomerase 1, peroxisomal [Momordica charantia]
MCSLQRRGNVFLLTLTGPGEHRLNPTLIDAIKSSLSQVRSEAESAAGNPSSFALITTAEGKFFSNGYDIDWAASSLDREYLMDDKLKSVASDLITLPMPTIAAVSGHASAAGFVLAMSHDYILMRRDRGFLYMSELDIRRVIPSWFMALVKNKIGAPVARRDVVLKAPKLTADKALEMGIIDSAHDSAAETVAAAVRLGEELVARNWDGPIYARNRVELLSEVLNVIGTRCIVAKL